MKALSLAGMRGWKWSKWAKKLTHKADRRASKRLLDEAPQHRHFYGWYYCW